MTQGSFNNIDSQRTAISKAAAHWWASFLYEVPVTHQSGDAYLDKVFAEYGKRIAMPSLDAHHIEGFEQCLAAGINWMLTQAKPTANDPYYIDCDYKPSPLLSKAAEYVGIDLYMRIPIKTSMRIDGNTIECKVGYGQPYEVIYTTTAEIP